MLKSLERCQRPSLVAGGTPRDPNTEGPCAGSISISLGARNQRVKPHPNTPPRISQDNASLTSCMRPGGTSGGLSHYQAGGLTSGKLVRTGWMRVRRGGVLLA